MKYEMLVTLVSDEAVMARRMLLLFAENLRYDLKDQGIEFDESTISYQIKDDKLIVSVQSK